MNWEDIKWTNLYKVLDEFADYFVRTAQDKIQANGSIAIGTLNSTMEISFNNDYLSVKISLQEYWRYLDEGTKPHMPPVDAIRQWVEVKLNVPDVERVSWAVAKTIAKKGTEAQPFMEDSKNEAYQHFEAAISYAIEADIAEYLEDTLINELGALL